MGKKMRAVMHSQRVGGGKHNDRQFDLKAAGNIDPTKTHLNKTWKWSIPGGTIPPADKTFEQQELELYNYYFGDQLDTTNNNYRKQRHAEKVKEMSDWKKQRIHAPEEQLLQVGKWTNARDGDIDPVRFEAAFLDYLGALEDWNNDHGCPMVLLDAALHLDESTPHIHLRRTWQFRDDQGRVRQGQEKALEAAGITLPYPDFPEGQKNNRKVAFDEMCRSTWKECLRKQGFDIEEEPLPAKKTKKKEEYIRDLIQGLENKKDALQAECADLEAVLPDLQKEVSLLRKEKSDLDAVLPDLREEYKHLQYMDRKYPAYQAEYDRLKNKVAELRSTGATTNELIDAAKRAYRACPEALQGILAVLAELDDREPLRVFVEANDIDIDIDIDYDYSR